MQSQAPSTSHSHASKGRYRFPAAYAAIEDVPVMLTVDVSSITRAKNQHLKLVDPDSIVSIIFLCLIF